ncbi:signal peptidase I [Streptomyces sp. NPDC055722]
MRKRRGLTITAWLLGTLGLLLLVGSVTFSLASYSTATVSSDSMAPTYTIGQRIVFERVGGDDVRRGDVVLYTAPERYQFNESVMQRVIAVGGDHVSCCTGLGTPQERITVDGWPLEEPYVKDGVADGMHRPYEVTVPDGRLFLLGDHRVNARDSRFFTSDHGGTVPATAVQGRVIDNYTVPVLLGVAALLGLLLALAGLGFGIAAWAVRRRVTPPLPPWPVQA